MASHAFQLDTAIDKLVKEADGDQQHLEDNVRTLFMSIEEKAANIIFSVFPSKVTALNEMYLKLAAIEYKTAHKDCEVEVVPPSKKRKAPDGDPIYSETVPCNDCVVKLMDSLKAEILELVQNAGAVKMWLNLNIPRIEDGNNFGVSIQEEAVAELGRAEDSSFAVMESMTKYYVTRGKLVSKVLKYPGIADYLRCVNELDEKQYVSLQLCCLDLRNNYCVLYDMIRKNMEKLTRPRGTPHTTTQMY